MSELRTIVRTLRSRECQQINFPLAGITVNGRGYRQVARAIERGDIQLVRALVLRERQMLYDWHYNFIGFNRAPRESTIIHECTHAQNDAAGREIPIVDDEAPAHLAQHIYLKLNNPALRSEAAVSAIARNTPLASAQCVAGHDRTLCEQAVAGWAAIMAEGILNRRLPADDLLEQLRTAIRNHPDYVPILREGERRRYLGLRRVPIPPAELIRIRGTVVHPAPRPRGRRRAGLDQGISPRVMAGLRGPLDPLAADAAAQMRRRCVVSEA